MIRPKKGLERLKPYDPCLSAAKYKLDANENAYELPGVLKKRMLARIKSLALNRYPEPGAPELRTLLAKKHGLGKNNIVIGNGSDELIHYIIQAYCGTGDTVAAPSPSFDMYRILALANGCKPHIVPLDDSFDLETEKMKKAAARAKVVFMPYPNNPTGNCFSRDRVMEVINSASGIVVIDEAYHEFSHRTFMPLVKKRRNVAVLRTFSKAYSMAGVRLGYMACAKETAKAVNSVRLPYNVNSVSQACGIEALKYGGSASIKLILEQKEVMYAILKKQYPVVKSDANFLLVRVKDAHKAKKLFEKSGISIRIFRDERLKNFIRITAGKPGENMAVLKVMERGV